MKRPLNSDRPRSFPLVHRLETFRCKHWAARALDRALPADRRSPSWKCKSKKARTFPLAHSLKSPSPASIEMNSCRRRKMTKSEIPDGRRNEPLIRATGQVFKSDDRVKRWSSSPSLPPRSREGRGEAGMGGEGRCGEGRGNA